MLAAALRKAMVRGGLCVEARKSPAHFVDIDTGFSVYRDDVPLRQCFKNRDMTSVNYVYLDLRVLYPHTFLP